MPLLLSDDDAREVLRMDDCLGALESAYKQEGLGTAANRTKSTIYIRGESGSTTHYVSMEGGISDPPVFVLRVRAHQPMRSGPFGAYILMLFSGETGGLLAVLRSREVSSWRVGGTAGLAAREMARQDAQVVGILGSGGTARAHVLAYAAVRRVQRFKVHSPNPQHRADFAEWVTRMTEVPAQAFDTPEEVVRGSDIVAACTSSPVPFLNPDWLDKAGVHMTGVQLGNTELEPEGLARFDRLVTYMSGVSTHHPTDPDVKPERRTGTDEEYMALYSVIPHRHTLVDLLMGRAPGRASETENNYFLSEGTGVQFGAVAALVYERARQRGVGQEMPEEWARWLGG